MISFTTLETIASVCSAFVFGAVFAFLDMIFKLITLELGHIKKVREHVFDSVRFFSLPKRAIVENGKWKEKRSYIGEIVTFFKIVFFALGFIILSYYSLDGAIRLYILFFSIISFFVFGFLFDKTVFKIADTAFIFLYGIFIVCLRIFCRPLMLFGIKIKNYVFDGAKKIKKNNN